MVGTVTLVYDHHVRTLSERLTGMQHDHHRNILSTMHVHLDHDNCLEVLVVKGKAGPVRKIADGLISTKGVKHGRLTVTTTGAGLCAFRNGALRERPKLSVFELFGFLPRIDHALDDGYVGEDGNDPEHLGHTVEQSAR